MPNQEGWDDVDRGCAFSVKMGWFGLLGTISSFGWCWLLTWWTNFRDLRAISGQNDPIIAGILAVGPILIYLYISSQIDNA